MNGQYKEYKAKGGAWSRKTIRGAGRNSGSIIPDMAGTASHKSNQHVKYSPLLAAIAVLSV